MQEYVDKICRLLCSTDENRAIAFQIMEGNLELKEAVEGVCEELLLLFNKNTLEDVPAILKRIRQKKCTTPELFKLCHIPIFREEVTNFTYGSIFHQPKDSIFPKELLHLINVETFWLRYSQINALPENINALYQLKEFRFIGNKITALPDSIGTLRNLKTLELRGNALTNIPSSIGGCAQLEDSLKIEEVDS